MGKSLLPAGVREVHGRFGRGDPVAIADLVGNQLGLGLTRYTSDEAAAIKGLRSGDIEAALGYPGRAALIHRDDMGHTISRVHHHTGEQTLRVQSQHSLNRNVAGLGAILPKHRQRLQAPTRSGLSCSMVSGGLCHHSLTRFSGCHIRIEERKKPRE